MADIIGIDHIYISVSDMQKSIEFYDVVMKTLGFKKNSFSANNVDHVQYYNRHFGYVLRAFSNNSSYKLDSPGLHHFCFRTEKIEDVHEIASSLLSVGVEISKPKCYPQYAEDYYAIYFYDPDGMMLEITNYREERKNRYQNWDVIFP